MLHLHERTGESYRVWSIFSRNSLSIKQEPTAFNLLALAIAESIHQFAELSGAFDLEEDFVVVVRDLYVEVVGLVGLWGGVLFRHGFWLGLWKRVARERRG
jgi:hypothetical protein